MTGPEYSIVIESYNLAEGGDRSRFRGVVQGALELAGRDGGEVLVTEVSGSPEFRAALARDFPGVGVVDAAGLGYDDAKMRAAQAAHGRFVLFLDGDCRPAPGWKEALLGALRDGLSPGVGGFTRYEGGFLEGALSIMDFGFLIPREKRPLKCYASNNSGFVRAELLKHPAVGRGLRCACFLHAQQFLRRGTPVMMVPEAVVLHEPQPLVRERTRQGYDRVAALRDDPALPEAGLLRLGAVSIPAFYLLALLLDWSRTLRARRALDLGLFNWLALFPLFPVLRLLDLVGMAQAFRPGR